MARLSMLLVALLSVEAVAARLDPADLEAFADGVIETSMENERVAGAVLGVVADGEVVLLKGYGYSDIAAGVEVDPQTTLFRPGSVSKLFTWVALMQLREAGKLDFNTDINTYLEDVQVPEAFGEPITITHLMTHTPGFEDHVLGLFGRTEATMVPLEQLLRDQMPARVRPPGQLASYSNHGVALAGLIVQNVSGEPWAQYIENHILEPLGMEYTTMRQPLPEHLVPHMSKGYGWESGRYVEKPFEFVPAAPAGSASASGGDMVKLVQAFLEGGGPVLTPAANRQMQSVLFRANEAAGGLMHGFYEMSSHGQLMLGHGGDTIWFHSELVLMPEQQIGWFLSTNSAAGPAVRSSFHREFLDRYFDQGDMQPVEADRVMLARFAGTYSAVRHAHDDITKMIKLLGPVSVRPSPDGGELLVVGGGEVARFEPIGETSFKSALSETVVSFDVDASGRATHMHMSTAPVVAFERMSGLDSPMLHWFVLAASMLVFLAVLVLLPIQHFTRRFLPPRSVHRFRVSAWWMSLAAVVFVAMVGPAMGGPNEVVFGISPLLRVLLWIPWLIAALALLSFALWLAVVREDVVGVGAKSACTLVMLAGLGFVWFAWYWQIL